MTVRMGRRSWVILSSLDALTSSKSCKLLRKTKVLRRRIFDVFCIVICKSISNVQRICGSRSDWNLFSCWKTFFDRFDFSSLHDIFVKCVSRRSIWQWIYHFASSVVIKLRFAQKIHDKLRLLWSCKMHKSGNSILQHIVLKSMNFIDGTDW